MRRVVHRAKAGRLRWLAAVLVILTAALGPYLLPIDLFGVNFYGFRILVIVLALLLVSNRGAITVGGSVSRFYFLVGYLWLLWGIASLLYLSPEFVPGLTEVLAVGFGFLTGLVLLNLVRYEEKGLQALRIGWMFAFIFSATVAVWEIFSGRHLPGHLAEQGSEYVLSNVVISTFGNPNNYAAFLTICFPFLLWSVLVSKGFVKLFSLISFAILPFLLATTAGRLGMFAFALQLLLFFVLSARSLRSLIRSFLILFPVSIIFVLALQANMFALSKFSTIFYELQAGGSVGYRVNMVFNGILFVIASGGLGVGAGSFEYMIERGHGLYEVGTSINPHNFWIEIVSQYGVFVFAGFVGWLAWVTLLALSVRKAALKRKDEDARLTAEIVLVALAGYLFATVANSAYIEQPMNWVFLGSILSIISYLTMTKSPKGLTRAVKVADLTR